MICRGDDGACRRVSDLNCRMTSSGLPTAYAMSSEHFVGMEQMLMSRLACREVAACSGH